MSADFLDKANSGDVLSRSNNMGEYFGTTKENAFELPDVCSQEAGKMKYQQESKQDGIEDGKCGEPDCRACSIRPFRPAGENMDPNPHLSVAMDIYCGSWIYIKRIFPEDVDRAKMLPTCLIVPDLEPDFYD
ncbi:protein V32 [Spheniscid alphaherpesvirus 1]|uniref:Protein V32 n=1 Tax=Spheniscid alphaherpesvirus 1 TaxID=2560777 RepID=A0A1R3T8N2_9ALPH|nr:protein V32 [Spheniscid alphaherpesvirus 1]SCO83552.1 protein V32 [Spheniscid alphaherpesvirus 1]